MLIPPFQVKRRAASSRRLLQLNPEKRGSPLLPERSRHGLQRMPSQWHSGHQRASNQGVRSRRSGCTTRGRVMRLHSGQSLRVLISKMLLSLISAFLKMRPHQADASIVTFRTSVRSFSDRAFSATSTYLSPCPSVQKKLAAPLSAFLSDPPPRPGIPRSQSIG